MCPFLFTPQMILFFSLAGTMAGKLQVSLFHRALLSFVHGRNRRKEEHKVKLASRQLKRGRESMRNVIFTSSTLLIINQVLTSSREVWDIMSGDTDSGFHPNISTKMDISTL